MLYICDGYLTDTEFSLHWFHVQFARAIFIRTSQDDSWRRRSNDAEARLSRSAPLHMIKRNCHNEEYTTLYPYYIYIIPIHVCMYIYIYDICIHTY